MKDVIIRGGENVYCAEVEAALLEHPRVRDAAVVGLPHHDYGEEVAAVIQVAPEHFGSEDDIRESLSDRLARFKIPTTIRLVEADLPRTATGKILKRELRTTRAAHSTPTVNYILLVTAACQPAYPPCVFEQTLCPRSGSPISDRKARPPAGKQTPAPQRLISRILPHGEVSGGTDETESC